MIIWIASYPKSGNTWLRSIISALVYSKDGIFTFDKLSKIDQFPEKKFFKDLVKNYPLEKGYRCWRLLNPFLLCLIYNNFINNP